MAANINNRAAATALRDSRKLGPKSARGKKKKKQRQEPGDAPPNGGRDVSAAPSQNPRARGRGGGARGGQAVTGASSGPAARPVWLQQATSS